MTAYALTPNHLTKRTTPPNTTGGKNGDTKMTLMVKVFEEQYPVWVVKQQNQDGCQNGCPFGKLGKAKLNILRGQKLILKHQN
jgi:hypothetical protein